MKQRKYIILSFMEPNHVIGLFLHSREHFSSHLDWELISCVLNSALQLYRLCYRRYFQSINPA
jgi:hypothetical protein